MLKVVSTWDGAGGHNLRRGRMFLLWPPWSSHSFSMLNQDRCVYMCMWVCHSLLRFYVMHKGCQDDCPSARVLIAEGCFRMAVVCDDWQELKSTSRWRVQGKTSLGEGCFLRVREGHLQAHTTCYNVFSASFQSSVSSIRPVQTSKERQWRMNSCSRFHLVIKSCLLLF